MANNPYVNKVVKEGTTLIDLSADTALAADVAQGKYFHLATGERVAGTASAGGGAVIQDQDGFLVLSDQGGGGGGGDRPGRLGRRALCHRPIRARSRGGRNVPSGA